MSLSPLPNTPPPNPTNRFADDPAAALLGQAFSSLTSDSQSTAPSPVQHATLRFMPLPI